MIEIARSIPPTLFAIASMLLAYVLRDLGRRWIAMRDKTRVANERMDALEEVVRDRLELFDKAIVIKAKAVSELGERVERLETQTDTDRMATRGFGRRRPNPLEG
jgi:hypothetical protein